MSIKVAAEFAEVLVSPDYRSAVNEAYDADPENYLDQMATAEGIVFSVLQKRLNERESVWEMRRQAALSELDGNNIGPFGSFVHRRGGLNEPSGMTTDELEPSNEDIVRTNSRVLRARADFDEPIDFLEAALDVIDERKQQNRHKQVSGPENYATSLKFFTDKFFEFPSGHLDPVAIKEQVDRCMDGFIGIAKKDAPNFIEMGNLYASIKHLPKGSFDAKFTPDIIRFSLDQLPNYGVDEVSTNGVLNLMVSALGKLDLSGSGEVAATLIDLALRQGKRFETSRDYLFTLRAISNLPASPAANRSFASFIASRNNIERSLDINGCDAANEQLARIAIDVIDDPKLTLIAKELTRSNTARATQLLRQAQALGEVTDDRLKQLQQTVRKIASNFSRI